MQLLTEIYTAPLLFASFPVNGIIIRNRVSPITLKVFKHTFNKCAAFSLHRFLQGTSQNY